MEWIKTIIYGIVEGITEWLPISSTGHMILVEQFLHMSTSHEFNSMFRVVIQLGAILAVVVLYFPKLWPFCSPRDGWIKKDTWILWFKVLVAALPAAIIGLPFDDLLDHIRCPFPFRRRLRRSLNFVVFFIFLHHILCLYLIFYPYPYTMSSPFRLFGRITRNPHFFLLHFLIFSFSPCGPCE